MELSDTCSSPQVLDPLLKDFSERKQSFRRSVVSLASELKEARSRLASNEELVARESLIRQAAETRAKCMEEEMCYMKNCLEESNEQLQATASIAEKYLKELDNLRSQHSTTHAVADANAALAHSAELQCLSLLKEPDEKNISLRERENRAVRLEVQLGFLQKDIDMREASQNQLKNGVLRIQKEILQASVKSSARKDSELKKISDEISPKSLEEINKHFSAKDEEMAKLREEIRTTSANWNLKVSELESQLENQRRINQELKKRVLKLDFCLQEARSQMRKLQRIGEKREQALKELKKQLGSKQQQGGTGGTNKQNFWESSGFKILVSMSMLILVVFAKR